MEITPKKEMSFRIMNFDSVQLPQFIERPNTQKGWIEMGMNNLFPQYLQSLLAKSPIHRSIVEQKSRMIGGYGFLKTNLNIKTLMFLKNPNGNFDLDELLYRCAYDNEIYGAYALNIIWSKDGERIAQIEYVDVAKLRVKLPEKDKGYPQLDHYWICDDWSNTRKYPPVLYQEFSTQAKQKKSQILYVKEHGAGVEWYGIPKYIAAVEDMESQFLISDYHMNGLRNGFNAGTIFQIPASSASDDERMIIAERAKMEWQGTSNNQKVIIQFIDDPQNPPNIIPIPTNDSDSRFMILDERTKEHILDAHMVVNPVIFGVQTPGKLGGTSKNEFIEAIEAFQNIYAIPKQNELAKVFNRLARINGITDNLIINKYSAQFRNIATNTQDVLSILTSTLTPDKQFWFLVSNGYDHETATKLTGYTEGNNLKAPKLPVPSEQNPEENKIIE